MNRQTRKPAAFSKVSVKSQTVIPREVRERLALKLGDTSEATPFFERL
jgi:bifunctional DNA-binding transcriptional regulator/antitoxin component of YhaV-PrlF toxin-antitoxin module